MTINKQLLLSLFAALAMSCAMPFGAQAENLEQIYQQALSHDPLFKKARAQWLSSKERFPLAVSNLYPSLDLSGSLSKRYHLSRSTARLEQDDLVQQQIQVVLTQQIFNYATWKAITGARFSVKAATANFMAASQGLMFRTIQAYFNVLRAYDQLTYASAKQNAFSQQLKTAKEKFKVGLIPITNVYDAQASYDATVAEVLQVRYHLANQLENLSAMTGQRYTTLSRLKKTLTFVMPTPLNMDAWVQIANRQSYAIQSTLNAMLAAREQVKQTNATRYPTVTAQASYDWSRSRATSSTFGKTGASAANVSLNVGFPIFKGGFLSHTAKQKKYDYLALSSQLEWVHRDVVKKTRQAYLGVSSAIYKIKADQEAIHSAKQKLQATRAGYKLGTRTIADVLNAVTSFYEAESQWSNDRYGYIINVALLKQQAGTLLPADLNHINAWLSSIPLYVASHRGDGTLQNAGLSEK